MHQHSIIIEIAEQLRKALAGAEQKALILHGETGVLIQVQGAPQYLYPLAVPVRPQVFRVLSTIPRSRHCPADATPAAPRRFAPAVAPSAPGCASAPPPVRRAGAQATAHLVRMFFVRHDAINHRHTHRTITRRSDLPCQLPRPGVVKLRASSGIGFPCASYRNHSAVAACSLTHSTRLSFSPRR